MQMYPGSIWQVDEQPSPLLVFPSSQFSLWDGWIIPFPQVSKM
jgi:hypothetical protein